MFQLVTGFLAPDDLALLRPHLREVSLFSDDLLHQPGEKIEQVYFLQSGIVSLMAVLEGGASVETVSIGCEGAIGTIEGFGSLHAFTAARVQVGGSALRMPGPVFRRTLDQSARLKWGAVVAPSIHRQTGGSDWRGVLLNLG